MTPTLEQSSDGSQRAGVVIQPIQTVDEDVFFIFIFIN